ncbi:MAG: hypothetical protein ACRC4M_04330 [Mycoplasma sp.]
MTEEKVIYFKCQEENDNEDETWTTILKVDDPELITRLEDISKHYIFDNEEYKIIKLEKNKLEYEIEKNVCLELDICNYKNAFTYIEDLEQIRKIVGDLEITLLLNDYNRLEIEEKFYKSFPEINK